MSKEIDWSRAPEGARYARQYAGGVDFYKRDGNGKWVYFDRSGNWSTAFGTSEEDAIERPDSWNGEGLTPAVRHLREEALRVLEYKPETGMLIWKENKQSRFVGREAGSVNHHGYRRMHLLSTRIDAHRLIWLMHYGSLPDGEVDHINGNKLDNRLENLRLADQQRNQQNTGVRCDSRLGIKGVRIRPSGKYQARVKLTDGSRLVKSFYLLDSAVAWLSFVRKESHGAFARDSAEQIAAEERLESAAAMFDFLYGETCSWNGLPHEIQEKYLAAYDAGYRKCSE